MLESIHSDQTSAYTHNQCVHFYYYMYHKQMFTTYTPVCRLAPLGRYGQNTWRCRVMAAGLVVW